MHGNIALDGKVEVPAHYEHVELFPDGRAELTVFSGKVIFWPMDRDGSFREQ